MKVTMDMEVRRKHKKILVNGHERLRACKNFEIPWNLFDLLFGTLSISCEIVSACWSQWFSSASNFWSISLKACKKNHKKIIKMFNIQMKSSRKAEENNFHLLMRFDGCWWWTLSDLMNFLREHWWRALGPEFWDLLGGSSCLGVAERVNEAKERGAKVFVWLLEACQKCLEIERFFIENL